MTICVEESGIGDFWDGLEENTKIFKYPCCSKLKGKYIIIGEILKSYYRIYSNRYTPNTCTDCEEYNMCDKCIDRTENGSYPTTTIYNTLFTVDSKEFCMRCKGHSRTLIPVPVNECNTIGVFTATLNLETCSHCFSHMNDKYQIAKRNIDDPAWIKKMTKDLKLSRADIETIIIKRGIFARLDDCMSCT